MVRLKTGLIALILLPFMTGCASSPIPVQAEKPDKSHLLQETPIPEYHGSTNGEIVEYAAELAESLKSCNADKRAARGSDGLPVNSDAVR